MSKDKHSCWGCGEEVYYKRWELGHRLCMPCGEAEAKRVKHCIAIPYSKGAYQYISNAELMKQTNPKRTT